MDAKVKILVKENEINEILIQNNVSKIDFVVKKNATLIIKCVNYKANELKINGQLESNARVESFIIDFAKNNFIFCSEVVLMGKNAEFNWNLLSIANQKYQKKFNIHFLHQNENNKVNVNNIALTFDVSFLSFFCLNHINKKAKNSLVSQNSKVFILNQYAQAKIVPTLKIDNFDVIANHTAVISNLDNNNIFYLKSRGLTECESKKIIILSYLKKITDKFNSSLINQKIHKILEKI
jgi:Fe-S cluster assembly scaffold protein SufB